MAASLGTVRVHQADHTVTFAVEGRGTVTHSLPMRRVAECCLAGGAAHVRVDLRACTYMDSTFLGTLLMLRSATANAPQGTLTLVSPSLACDRLLDQMGVTDFFERELAPECPGPWVDLPTGTDDVEAWKCNVLQAHEKLAELPGPVGDQFRAVMQCAAQGGPPKGPSGPGP